MGIGVIAKLAIRPDAEAEFEKTFAELAAKVQANEPGCKFYQLFKSREGQGQYVVLEHYESQEAFEAHGKSEHFRAAQPALGKCVAGPPSLTMLDEAAG